MIRILSDNILSPLGETTADNLQAVRAYRSGLREHHQWQIPEPFVASLFQDGEGERPTYEQLILRSIQQCLDPAVVRGRVLLILASTKGQTTGSDGETFGTTAQRIVERLRALLPDATSLQSLTVSNACISGLSAQIIARRLLEMEACDVAIVTGCDVQTRFIVSGFQSFHALSPEPCRPFDEDRCGLNLGEAAATLILGRCSASELQPTDWVLLPGFMRNDAYHISAPSRTAEGSTLALQAAMQASSLRADDLLTISAHGTATLYNDDMESQAVNRAGLQQLPVSSLKGYFGHTMGAAGILESIVTLHALQEGWIPGTLGYHALGTLRPLQVSAEHQPLEATIPSSSQTLAAVAPSSFPGGKTFLKLISGFGGCNAAMPYHQGFLPLKEGEGRGQETIDESNQLATDESNQLATDESNQLAIIHPTCLHHLLLTPTRIELDGVSLWNDNSVHLVDVYKHFVGDYPRFYKMDALARLGFLASELLIRNARPDAGQGSSPSSEAGPVRTPDSVLLMGITASLSADRQYERSIQPGPDYFPSPSDFVYTLPNIVTGEIAMRHHIHGETCYLALQQRDESLIDQLVRQAFLDPDTHLLLAGWIDASDDEHFIADLSLYEVPPTQY